MPLAGALVRASDIRPLNLIRKAAGESVTSSTTVQNDDDIAISLDVGLWAIDLYAAPTGAAAGDIKLVWSTTGTMTNIHRSVVAPPSGVTDVSNGTEARIQANLGLTTEIGFATDGTRTSLIHEHLLMEVTVAGVITLRWAQLASSGTATTMGTQTHVTWQQVDEQ